MRYQILTYTLCEGWVNIWTDNEVLITFDSLDQAQKELQDFLSEMAESVQLGYLDDFNPEDYKIEKVQA